MRMKFVFTALFLVLSTGCGSTHTEPQHVFAVEHPEASPFDETADAKADVERALKKGAVENKITLVAMGANWCHDSRALAGWFETDSEFQNVIKENYSLVYVDVGQKNRNIDIAQRFGYDEIVGTPTIFMVSPDGTVLNSETAGTWRNSASRTKSEIFSALETASF